MRLKKLLRHICFTYHCCSFQILKTSLQVEANPWLFIFVFVNIIKLKHRQIHRLQKRVLRHQHQQHFSLNPNFHMCLSAVTWVVQTKRDISSLALNILKLNLSMSIFVVLLHFVWHNHFWLAWLPFSVHDDQTGVLPTSMHEHAAVECLGNRKRVNWDISPQARSRSEITQPDTARSFTWKHPAIRFACAREHKEGVCVCLNKSISVECYIGDHDTRNERTDLSLWSLFLRHTITCFFA